MQIATKAAGVGFNVRVSTRGRGSSSRSGTERLDPDNASSELSG